LTGVLLPYFPYYLPSDGARGGESPVVDDFDSEKDVKDMFLLKGTAVVRVALPNLRPKN
jgi:hypothetical protein